MVDAQPVIWTGRAYHMLNYKLLLESSFKTLDKLKILVSNELEQNMWSFTFCVENGLVLMCFLYRRDLYAGICVATMPVCMSIAWGSPRQRKLKSKNAKKKKTLPNIIYFFCTQLKVRIFSFMLHMQCLNLQFLVVMRMPKNTDWGNPPY